MAVSTIPALRTALLARLAAESWPTSTPQIARSHPYPAHEERELVYLLGTRPEDPIGSDYGGGTKPAQLGAGRLEERYVQPVVVSVVWNARDDVTDLELRAFELAGVITASARAWGKEASPWSGIVRWCLPSSVQLDGPHLIVDSKNAPKDREVAVTVDLACSARI